jgi:uncharacterized protein YdcH (DUF465 family)
MEIEMSAHSMSWFLEDENAEAFAALDVEQMAALSKGGTVELGDTSEAAPAVVEDSDGSPAVAEPEPEPVVLARDGKNTIPYRELEAARAKSTELEALSHQQAALITELQAAKVADAGTGATAAQDDVMAKLLEEYPELAETLAPIFARFEGGSKAEVAALRQELAALKQELAPIQKTVQDNSVEAHFAAIRGAHSDFDAVMASGKVHEWVATLPSYARTGAENVIKAGSTDEVIELLGQYKATLPKTVPDAKDIETKALAAISKAKSTVPVTLGQVPANGTSTIKEEPTDLKGYAQHFSALAKQGMTPMQIINSM